MGSDGFFDSEEEELAGQVQAWKFTFAFVDSLAVKCAVLLGIPDMIAREGPRATLSLDEIVARLPTESPDATCLFRIMRFLVAKDVFRASVDHDGAGNETTRYGLAPASKWLVKERRELYSMAPMLLIDSDERAMAPWHRFNECVLGGGIAFERANGAEFWPYACAHPDFDHLFNSAMASHTGIVKKALLSNYHGFNAVNSLVDVGGGTGSTLAEIVRAYPSIRGINYDLPHVVATAPHYPGVEHQGGDMFEAIPPAEAIFMKWIMHDWSDAECIKILKNCREAIPAETGKVIIVDVVLGAADQDEKLGLVFDLLMLALSSGGKERTEKEWNNILTKSGFPRYNTIRIPGMLQSLIEAFPS